MSNQPVRVPSEEDFLAAFGVAPIESAPADGYWCYRFENGHGHNLRFSFNTHEGSVQTVWESEGHDVCTVVHEMLEELRIHDEPGEASIAATFANVSDVRTRKIVQILPQLEVSWSTLRI